MKRSNKHALRAMIRFEHQRRNINEYGNHVDLYEAGYLMCKLERQIRKHIRMHRLPEQLANRFWHLHEDVRRDLRDICDSFTTVDYYANWDVVPCSSVDEPDASCPMLPCSSCGMCGYYAIIGGE